MLIYSHCFFLYKDNLITFLVFEDINLSDFFTFYLPSSSLAQQTVSKTYYCILLSF